LDTLHMQEQRSKRCLDPARGAHAGTETLPKPIPQACARSQVRRC
jgi:hypothetical protein